MDTEHNRPLLTRREAASSLGISIDSLMRLIDRRELHAVRLGRSVRVPATELQSLVERQLATSSVGES